MAQHVDSGARPRDGAQARLTGIRRTAARRMEQAWQAPVFHLGVEIDMTCALAGRGGVGGATVTDVLLHACAQTLRQNREVNAHYESEIVTTYEVVNLGMAVATDAGLIVPVIHNADELDLAGISQARKDLTVRARERNLTMDNVTGGTFTVSNLGMMGIDHFDAILNTPQVAILAVGSTRQQHVWNDGDPTWRPVAEMTLTCDHRVLDGAAGARFLSALRDRLQADAACGQA